MRDRHRRGRALDILRYGVWLALLAGFVAVMVYASRQEAEAAPGPDTYPICRVRPWRARCLELAPAERLPRPPARFAACATVRCVVDEVWADAGYGWELEYMHGIVECESGWDPTQTGAAGEVGLFQLLPKYHAWRWGDRDPYDPEVNAEAAVGLRHDAGWSPWSCAR